MRGVLKSEKPDFFACLETMELAILLDLDLEYEQRSPYFSSIQALIVSGLTVRVRIVRDAFFEKMPRDAKDEQRSVAAVTTSSVHGGITE